MKKVIIAVIILAVLSSIVITSVVRQRAGKGEKVYVEEASSRDIVELVKAGGEVDARNRVNISSHLIGKIEKLYVEEGDEVKAGDRFLELEKEAFVAGRDDWSSRLAMAQSSVRQAQVSLADAELRAERGRRLNEEGILSRESLEQQELNRTAARLELERSRESVAQARANLNKVRDDLAKTTLYAPISGRVVSLQAEEGEVVVSGTMNNPASVIATIADLSEILAEVDVDETEVARVKVGQSAVLHVDALADQEFTGRVIEVGSSGYGRAGQPDVTFFLVKLLFENASPELRPGMSVRADIRTAETSGVITVPIQAVVERPPLKAEADGEGEAKGGEASDEEVSVVFLLDGGTARQVTVTTGLSDDTHVEITSGLEGGERVVTGPYRTLRDLDDGDAVRVRSARDDDEEDEDD